MANDPVTALADLVKEVFMWFTDPTKFQALTLDMKLEKLSNALKVALDARAMDAADLIYAELRRLSDTKR